MSLLTIEQVLPQIGDTCRVLDLIYVGFIKEQIKPGIIPKFVQMFRRTNPVPRNVLHVILVIDKPSAIRISQMTKPIFVDSDNNEFMLDRLSGQALYIKAKCKKTEVMINFNEMVMYEQD